MNTMNRKKHDINIDSKPEKIITNSNYIAVGGLQK